MIPAFLMEPFLDMASSIWAMPRELWIDDSPNLEDIEHLKQEAQGESRIDDKNLRSEMIEMWKRDEVILRVKVLPGRTRVVFLGTEDQWSQIPWVVWARIFQAVGPVKNVLFYAHPRNRDYPEPGTPIGPSNINAGYSYICDKKIVVIYRFEEATRVLLHEMLHTACFDKEKEVEDLEAYTEAWTEILLCALLSKGKPTIFNQLWKKQCIWIEQQVMHLFTNWNVQGRSDYAWRYIVGKYEVLEKYGFILTVNSEENPNVGLRFTTPELDEAILKIESMQ